MKAISAKELREEASGLTLLFVEDEQMLRESMNMILEKLFERVIVASNGQEAFEIFKKEKIDMLLTDVNMPIMSGIELIQSIHKHPSEDPVIVVLSAHNESKLLTTLINMGINNFINKPADKQLLINLLYRGCKIINDKKIIAAYEKKLEEDLEATERKNKILEQKINQLATQINKNVTQTSTTTYSPIKSVENENYFQTLLADDQDELLDLSYEIDNFVAMLFQAERLDENYILKLSNAYKKYSSILNTYPEFYDISSALHEFSQAILSLEKKFMQNKEQTGIYFESLQLTLDNYLQNVWLKEAKEPRFYNASLKMDIQFIIDYLEEKEVDDSEIEFF